MLKISFNYYCDNSKFLDTNVYYAKKQGINMQNNYKPKQAYHSVVITIVIKVLLRDIIVLITDRRSSNSI